MRARWSLNAVDTGALLFAGAVLLYALATLTGCANPILQASDESQKVLDRAEEKVERALERVDEKTEKIQERVEESLTKAKETYSESLTETSDEVSKLREDLFKSLEELRAGMRSDIAAARAEAQVLIADADEKVQARIDQIFDRLDKFMIATIAEIRALIQPVLTMSERVSELAAKGQESLDKLVSAVIAILDEFKAILKSARETFEKFTGKSKEDGSPSTPWEAIGAIIVALGTVLWRLKDKWGSKERWSEDQLQIFFKAHGAQIIKSGEFDDEIRGVLRRLGFVEKGKD